MMLVALQPPPTIPDLDNRQKERGTGPRGCYDTVGVIGRLIAWIPTMTHSGAFSVRRTVEEVFDLLSNPERFAPLMPDFESMTVQDATHFTMRTVIAIGEIQGHANLAMESLPATRPARVGYAGSATIAGGPLRMAIDFQIKPREEMTEVVWQGEVTLEGALAMMAENLLESMGRRNLDRMAERLQLSLQDEPLTTGEAQSASAPPAAVDFEI